MTAFSVTGLVNPATGLLQGSYMPMPSLYQLASGRYSPARKPLVLIHPRPDSETAADEFHRMAQTGQAISIKIKAAFGGYPYSAKIVQAPEGSTIGEWLEPNIHGDLIPTSAYTKITIPAQSAGDYTIAVRIFDQDGDNVLSVWTLNVGDNYYYAAPTAAGVGDGSSRANAASWPTAYGADDAAVSPALGKILELASGSYSFSQSVDINANKPRAWINQDGTQPEFVATVPEVRFGLKRDGIHLRGFKITGVTDAPVMETVNFYERQSIDQIEFNACIGDATGSFNEAGWFVWSTNNATKRPYFWADEITYTNCHELAGFDWYSVSPGIFERSEWVTNESMLMEPIWYPKASCDIDMRHLTFDNDVIDFDANGTVILIGNNETYSSASCHVRFCFVRTQQDSNLNSVTYNSSINASSIDNWDDHNTYLGGKVTAKNLGGDDLVNFSNTVIVNTLGGIGGESGGSTSENMLVGTSGIVDASGRITDSNRGIIGYQIWSPE